MLLNSNKYNNNNNNNKNRLRIKIKDGDPLICALGSLIAVPTLFTLVLVTRTVNQYLFWLIAALSISGMCLSWTMVADVLLYAIHPSKRSIASAINILVCHLLGDACSPYVIGAVSFLFSFCTLFFFCFFFVFFVSFAYIFIL